MSLPWNNLQSFVTDWFKGLQEIADSIAPDAGADNSMLPLASLPYRFDTTQYGIVYTRDVIDGYDTWDKGYGYQPWLFAYRLNLYNNVLRVLNCQYVGKNNVTSDKWSWLTDSDIATIESALSVVNGISIENSFPTEKIVINYSNYGNVWFNPAMHSDSDIKFKIPVKNGTFIYSDSVGAQFDLSTIPYDNNGYFNPPDIWELKTGKKPTSYKENCIIVFDNNLDASRLVNDVLATGSAHNDVINYTKSGSEYKLYYGDTYLVYALTDDKIYTYNDLYAGTKQATNTINAWNPTATPITTPTYNDVKYGAEIDKNHTKPMVLNKVVPDANGMVYYYELNKDDVWKVRSGLNTINLDVTVLKDVTRNLISYKIFAFSPTALIKTKTPVIVHIGGREIKYEGNSIPANYVEELNTIALGSINISKLFGDYRDYAPYTKIELFVPFCGWTTLPSWCIDTTITGELFVDMWNGSCKAVIKASALDAPDGVVVCEMGGVCAYDVPFVADATGAKAASLLSKVATTAGAVATGNPLAIATSGISLATALNENYTRMMGVVGDGSNINGLDHMFVKLTRVSWTDTHKKARPDAYKHMHGIPCGKQLTLTAGDGFTQIIDANITGAMTDREKQMIIDGFRHGLIL